MSARTKSVIDNVSSNELIPNVSVTNDHMSAVTVTIDCRQLGIDNEFQAIQSTASISVRQCNQSVDSLRINHYLTTLSVQCSTASVSLSRRCSSSSNMTSVCILLDAFLQFPFQPLDIYYGTLLTSLSNHCTQWDWQQDITCHWWMSQSAYHTNEHIYQTHK